VNFMATNLTTRVRGITSREPRSPTRDLDRSSRSKPAVRLHRSQTRSTR
jgi:hypothetical protein